MKPFSPDSAALVLIDHQDGTMKLIKTTDVDDVRRFTLALAKAAKILEMPVVLTSSQEDQLQGPIMSDLAEILPEAYEARVKRAGIVNAWTDPNFKRAIEATGRKELIVAGVTTDVCLVYAAIDMVDSGYEVQAVLDASGSPYEISEQTSRLRMEKAGVVLTATNTAIAELAQDWSTSSGKKLIKLMFKEVLPTIIPPVSALKNMVANAIHKS